MLNSLPIRTSIVALIFALLSFGQTATAQFDDSQLDSTLISNSFYQTDLTQAIQDVALQAGVNIIVAAQPLFVTDAVFDSQPLRVVLDLLLAGTGLIYDVKSSYIIIYDPREVDQIDNRNVGDFYQSRFLAASEAVSLLPTDLQPFTRPSDASGLINIYGPPPVVSRVKSLLQALDIYGLETAVITTSTIPPAAVRNALPRNLATYVTFDNDSNQLIARAPKMFIEQIRNYVAQMERNAVTPGVLSVPSTFEIYHPRSTPPIDLVQLLPPSLRQYVQATGASDLLTVAAEPEILAEIMTILEAMDPMPTQILLNAHIISMSARELIDEGGELGLPRVQIGAGFFRNAAGLQTPWGAGIGYSTSEDFSNALSLNLHMLAATSRASILSSPSVASMNNQPAEISFTSSVQQLISQSGGEGDAGSLRELSGGTSLSITPKVMGDRSIQLQIAVDVSDFDSVGLDDDTIQTSRAARTTLVVENGGTAVIGGLSSSIKKSLLSGVPGFDALFTRGRTEDDSVQLTILIRAEIIRTDDIDSSDGVIMMMDPDVYREQMRSALSSWGM